MKEPSHVTDRVRYPARFINEGGVVVVEFHRLAGTFMATQGADLEDARKKAREVLTGYLKLCFNRRLPLHSPIALPRGKGWEWVYPRVEAEIAHRIRQLREEAGLSQQQAAARLGISYTTYKRWEHPDQCNATLKTLERLADTFGRRLDVAFA